MKQLYTIVLGCAISASATAQLSGTKTIGGSNPDYPTITAAVNALNAQGASGNVIFDIRPGTYTGQYSLGQISGTPGSIQFRNSSNGSQLVNLEYDASGSSDNYIFKLDGTDDVVFEKLNFRPLDFNYARAIHFFNAVEGLIIEQCVFRGSTNPSGSAYFDRILVHCDQFNLNTNNNPQDVLILDNSFFDGNTAVEIDAYGFNGARCDGLIVSGNEFRQQIGTGIRLNHCSGSISDNDFSTTVGNWYVGIRTTFFDFGSQIRRNDIRAYATNGCTGIEVGNTQSTTGNMISNNMVYVNGTGDVWGLAVYNLWDMKIVHNSVLVANGLPEQSFAFYHLSEFQDGEDALVRNNLFANNTGGVAYKVNRQQNIAFEDHNGLFTTGPVLSWVGTNSYNELADHQTGTGQGAGDTDIDPVFPEQPDLHMNNCALDDLGEYYFVVAADMDGDARGNPACDMGADEFDVVSVVGTPAVIIDQTELPYELGLAADFNSYQWSTGATTPSITITSGGLYSCLVMDVNFCMYTVNVNVVVEITTDITSEEAAKWHLLPNPATDYLRINGLTGMMPYMIYDVGGRVVLQGMLIEGSPIAVDALPAGLYTMRIEDDIHSAVRFMKQ
ncbi:MAG TPA: T9SS type A sorting domain-containing protein [Flavobacteriales bacterium]|nr:T9SS type A sorting domain-containing protein [Flavobacteriales bacterium]